MVCTFTSTSSLEKTYEPGSEVRTHTLTCLQKVHDLFNSLFRKAEMSQEGKKFPSISDLLVNPGPAKQYEEEKPPKKALPRYAEEERERVKRRISGFDWRHSIAWQELTAQFGARLTQSELISIAELVSAHIKLKLDRDAKRRKTVLIKWFQEHWIVIYPILGMISLNDD